jgi:DNA-directed RNA polymerase subunit H (RpoH/RPB5)
MSYIWKARQTIASILDYRGYNVDSLKTESPYEVDVMISNETLNFNLAHPTGGSTVYVHFDMQPTSRKKGDLQSKFLSAYELKPTDTLMIICHDKPSGPFYEAIREVNSTKEVFVQVFYLKWLQFDIMKHYRMPDHKILSKEEEEDFVKKYKLDDIDKNGLIDILDPPIAYIGGRPNQIVKITRPSETSGVGYAYKRISVYNPSS